MSAIDSELALLKQRLAALEEQKRIETEKEAEKKANPMKVIETILDEKKAWTNAIIQKLSNNKNSLSNLAYHSKELQMIEHSNFNKPEIHLFNEQDKLAMLEPIFDMLQDIQKRLAALENK